MNFGRVLLFFCAINSRAEKNRRVVLVTGASRGVGKVICQKFAARGDAVVVNYRHDQEAAERVLDGLEGQGHCIHKCDVSDPADVLEMVTQISHRYGRLDVLVNNAAIYSEIPPLETSYETWQEVWQETIATNLIAPANLCWCAANVMSVQPSGGSIISVSSRGAYRGEPNAAAYGASKAGLNSLSQSMAKALGGSNIAVSVVAPGFIATEMAEEALSGPRGDGIRSDSPFNRVATPEEVADVVIFQSLETSRWLSGGVVHCNGASYLH